MTTTVNAVNITDMLTVLFLGHRTGVPKIAVVITDGNSNNTAFTVVVMVDFWLLLNKYS
jgi:hypothetical protein